MAEQELDPKIVGQIRQLQEKYALMGQDLSSYLDGLLYANYLTYWDYIHVDVLLNLQDPKTDFPDELIFIIYHQTTELNFKLILLEMRQMAFKQGLDEDFFLQRIGRINRYFRHLATSFDIMSQGMDREQFLKYRMSLLPASGFQSAQYRMIELCATDLKFLADKDLRHEITPESSIEDLMEIIYWKKGATELKTGEKTLTLRQFENKYTDELVKLAYEFRYVNLWQTFVKNFKKSPRKDEIINELRHFDVLVNVNWPLAHYKTAVRYLDKEPHAIEATGGTNWQKYLPPRFQRRVFFPELWSEQELADWGKGWVEENVFQAKK